MTYDYPFSGLPETYANDTRISPESRFGRPGFGFGFGRPGFGFGRPGFGLGLGFLGGLATGALLAPGPGFGYYYPSYPYYPPYPYPYSQYPNYDIPYSPY